MILLTFDTDYLSAEDLDRFVKEFPIPGQGTFFMWRPFAEFDPAGGHEIGTHPFLTDHSEPWRTAVEESIAGLKGPPRSVRPHSCVYSHLLGTILAKMGFTSISQASNLYADGMRPYRQPWGLWELPIYYMDSMDFTYPYNWPQIGHRPFARDIITRSLDSDALFVYDFHPLHVILNSSTVQQYQSVREGIVSGQRSVWDHAAFGGVGSRSFYLNLVEAMQGAGVRSATCSAAIAAAESPAQSIG